jgi:hypothetical protein
MNELTTLPIDKYEQALIQAMALEVKTPEQANAVNDFIKGNRALRAEAVAFTRPIIQAQQEALDKAKAQLRSYTAPLDQADTVANQKLTEYLLAKRDREEKERKRLKDEATKKADDDRLALALRAEEQGRPIAAAAIISAPSKIAKPVLAPQPAEPAGTQLRTVWKWTLVKIEDVPDAYKKTETKVTVLPDKEAIDLLVKTKHQDAQAILGAGIKVYSESTTAHRREW